MLKPFSMLTLGSAITLLLSAGTPALAGTSVQARPPIYLLCAGEEDMPICNAFAEALTQAAKGRDVRVWSEDTPVPAPYHMTIRFVQNAGRDDSLSGQLLWQTADGPAETGPTMEISVMDAALTEQMLTDFAKRLTHSSNIPL